MLTRVLATLDHEIRTKIEELQELEQFAQIDSTLLREGIEEYLRETLHEEMETSMNDILPEAFAVVREASKRTLNMPFRCTAHGRHRFASGKIAEMKTGEGKTLVSYIAGLSQCLNRARRACRHGQRLPGPARPRVDGEDL